MKIQFTNGTAYLGDALQVVKSLDSNSVDSVITSPPYYQLRDYGFDSQWGLEQDYKDYLNKMIELMSELKRVLKPTGTMWVNLGDTFNNISGNAKMKEPKSLLLGDKISEGQIRGGKSKVIQPMPNKSLMLIPHRFAIRCIDELGLILRNDIIWAKRNGMPESVTDRFSKKHEHIFFFVKQKDYYFDLDSIKDKLIIQNVKGVKFGGNKGDSNPKGIYSGNEYDASKLIGKNPGDVSDFWEITTKPNPKNHYATYNSELIRKPLIAGSPVGGVILDPFGGTGTTAFTAAKYDRQFIYIDANQEYFNEFTKEMNFADSQMKLEF